MRADPSKAELAKPQVRHAAEIDFLRQLLEETSQALASRSAETDFLNARATALESELARLTTSASWRATAPIREFALRYPYAARWLHRGLRLIWWTVTFQLPSRLHAWRKARGAIESNQPQSTSASAVSPEPRESRAWHGDDPIARADWFSHQGSSVDEATFDEQTQALWRRYFPNAVPEETPCRFIKFGPTGLIRRTLAAARAATSTAARSERVSYGIITIYYQHRQFFPACAASVESLIEADFRNTGDRRIEWIVVNDDPTMDEDELDSLIPANVKAMTHVHADGQHKGISTRLNQAIEATHKDWLLFLDCDDLVQPETPAVLDHYIGRFSDCRYISSDMIDIDDNGVELRRRHRVESPAVLYEYGMVAGHLKAIRRDLLVAAGGFSPQFSGCQDYDFALRIALQEPLLFIPEFLYSYRWHDSSVSVSRALQQNRLTRVVQHTFLVRYLDRSHPANARPPRELAPAPRGLCLVRTKGAHLERLAQTLQSVWGQTIPVVPCLIVHEEADTFGFIRQWARQFPDPLILLHAGVRGRGAGYPLNVGLDYAIAHRSDYDFVCILDPGDIFYPLFAERLCGAMALTGSDLAFGLTNTRSPDGFLRAGNPPLPAAALIAGNFIAPNSFTLHLEALLDSASWFKEDLYYLENWDFLLSLLAAGVRFHAVCETVAEHRLFDGDTPDAEQNSPLFADCKAKVVSRAHQVARSIGASAFYRDVATFDFRRCEPLSESTLNLLAEAHKRFESLPTIDVVKGI